MHIHKAELTLNIWSENVCNGSFGFLKEVVKVYFFCRNIGQWNIYLIAQIYESTLLEAVIWLRIASFFSCRNP